MYSNNKLDTTRLSANDLTLPQAPIDSYVASQQPQHRPMSDAPLSLRLLNQMVDAKIMRDWAAMNNTSGSQTSSDGDGTVFVMRGSDSSSGSNPASVEVSAEPAVEKRIPFVIHTSNRARLLEQELTRRNVFYVDRLHCLDRIALTEYVRTQKREGLNGKSWILYVNRLSVVSEYSRKNRMPAITDFGSKGDTGLDTLIGKIRTDKKKPSEFRAETKRELSHFFEWYNGLRQEAETAQLASADVGSHWHAILPAADPGKTVPSSTTTIIQLHKSETNRNDLEWMGRTARDISERTGLPVGDIEEISPLIEVNGLPLFISTRTQYDKSNLVGLANFLRYVEPAIDEKGDGLACFHLRGTAYSVVFSVDSGSGEVTELEIETECLDPGKQHPGTTTIEQLTRSLANRHNPDWMSARLSDIAQRTGIAAKDIAYVHYLAGESELPLFMTEATAANTGCEAEGIAEFFCYVWPNISNDGTGYADFIQNEKSCSVRFDFNADTGEVTSFHLFVGE